MCQKNIPQGTKSGATFPDKRYGEFTLENSVAAKLGVLKLLAHSIFCDIKIFTVERSNLSADAILEKQEKENRATLAQSIEESARYFVEARFTPALGNKDLTTFAEDLRATIQSRDNSQLTLLTNAVLHSLTPTLNSLNAQGQADILTAVPHLLAIPLIDSCLQRVEAEGRDVSQALAMAIRRSSCLPLS